MDDEFKRTLAAIKPLAKLLPRESDKRAKATQWIKKLISKDSSRYARDHYAGLLLTTLQDGHLKHPFTSSPPSGPLCIPSHDESLGDELETILQSITEDDLTVPRTTADDITTTWSSLPLSSTVGLSTNHPGPLHSTPHDPATAQRTNLEQLEARRQNSSPRSSGGLRGEWFSTMSELPKLSPSGKLATSQNRTKPVFGSSKTVASTHKQRARKRVKKPLSLSSSSSDNLNKQDADLLSNSLSPSTSSDSSGASDVAMLLDLDHLPRAKLQTSHSTLSIQPTEVTGLSDTLLSTRLSPLQTTVTSNTLSPPKDNRSLSSTEAQIHRERLQTQLHHAKSLKKILDRKNNEIEELKAQHRLQLQQEVAKRRRLEAKLSQEAEESSTTKMSIQQHQQLIQTRFEKKLHVAVSEFERQKLEMEQSHSQQVRQVIEQANSRVTQLQHQYKAQADSEGKARTEVEEKLKSLSHQLNAVSSSREQLVKEKLQLERKVDTVQTQLVIATKRAEVLEEERKSAVADKNKELQELQQKLELTISNLKHQLTVQQSQKSEEASQLHHEVKRLEQTLQETVAAHKLAMMESESCSWRQLREKEAENERKMSSLQAELEAKMSKEQEKVLIAESELREREKQLEELRCLHEEETSQARATMEEYRSNFESRTSKLFAEMKCEVGRLEEQVADCRAAKEKATEETVREKTKLFQKLKEKERLLQSLTASLQEEKAKATTSKKTTEDLEQTVQALSQQLEYQQSQHERETEEIKKAASIDKESALRIHKSAISKLKSQIETQRTRIRDEHTNELSNLMQKHQHQMEQLQLDKAKQTALVDETTTSLQAQISKLHSDFIRQQQLHAEEVTQLSEQHDQELAKMKLELEGYIRSLEEQCKSVSIAASQLQTQLQQSHLDREAKISKLKLHYETRLQGMLPAAARNDYEDTIQSLRSQVLVLSQKSESLQKELDRVKACSKIRKPSRTSTTAGGSRKHTSNS